jgi:hypothetical protein
MTLSSEHAEDKECPNCHGEGWEPKPPMRRCRLCQGSGSMPDPGGRAERGLIGQGLSYLIVVFYRHGGLES